MSKSSSRSGKGFGTFKLQKTKKLRVFALEPILTPSGLVDTLDDAPDPSTVEIPYIVGNLSQPTDQQLLPTADGQDIEELDTGDEAWTSVTPDSDTDLERVTPDLDSNWEEVPFITSYEPLSSVFESGVFVVGESGEVSVDFLFDGGRYRGELAFFSLEGMEAFEPGSEAFIQEAARRAMSGSELGHVVISDSAEGARFSGILGNSDRQDYNTGDYQGVKTFTMRPGDEFGAMMVPNGRVAELLNNPALNGNKHPLFSMSTANPDDAFQAGQIVDVTGDGNTFVFEDLRIDLQSDKDYNDIIFQVRGAIGQAPVMDELVAERQDWRTTDLGQALVEYTKPYIEPIFSDSEELTDPWMPEDGELPTDVPEIVEDQVHDIDTEESFVTANDSVTVTQQPLIGIIDTGFSENNPDINYDNITLGRDRVNNDTNPLLSPGEGDEHGTHVLGIIAAERDNGLGIDGINDQAPLWVGRAIGSGEWADSLIEYVDHFRESRQTNGIVNLSLDLTQINPDGSVTTRYELTPDERTAIEYARQNGVLLVVAAGNDGDVMSALGQASQEFDNIITVGAAERVNEAIASTGSMDRALYSSYGYGLDLLAPVGNSEFPEISTVGDGIGAMSGTSVATAKVTGAISQIWAANPSLNYRQIIEILKTTAIDLGNPGWDWETGAGLLNLPAALSLAKITTGRVHETPSVLSALSAWSGQGTAIPLDRAAADGFMGSFYNWIPYTIRSGDTLSAIALRTMGNGTAPYFNFIASKNGIANPNRIFVGQQILIPTKVAAPPPPPAPAPPSPPPPTGYYPELAPWSVAQWNDQTRDNTRFDVGWPDFRDERHLTLPAIRNIYTDLSNAIFGKRVPVTAGYLLDPGYREGIGIWHSGIDMSASRGTQVRVPVGGTIVRGIQETTGNYFIGVRGDDGKLWIYGHLGTVAVPGGRIEAGQVIGTIGSDNHLHLEVQAGPNYRRSQSSNQATVQAATLNPIKSYWELRNRNSQPGQPGQPGRRLYIVRPGDSLWAIAQRELGNGNRWREITNENGSPLTGTTIFPGQRLLLPTLQQVGGGKPVTPPPTSSPSPGNITRINFSGVVGPKIGVNLRHSPVLSHRSNRNEPSGKRLQFDAWTYGQTVTDLWLGTPDARWFRVSGTNFWVPSAYIYGNPPNSSPMPGGQTNLTPPGGQTNPTPPGTNGPKIYDTREPVNDEGWMTVMRARDQDWKTRYASNFFEASLLGNAWLAHQALKTSWQGLGWDNAAELLGVYLNANNGGEFRINLDEAIRESSEMARELIENFSLSEILDAVRQGHNTGFFGKTWDVAGSSDLFPNNNWLQALGGFSKRYEGSFQRNFDGTVSVSMQFFIKDVYDFVESKWNLTKSHDLHLHGLARAFVTTGESKQYNWRFNLTGMQLERPSEFASTTLKGTYILIR